MASGLSVWCARGNVDAFQEPDMRIIGDRHYQADAGEQITFSVGSQTQVASVVASGSALAGGSLPAVVNGGGHKTITIAVGFTGNTGGSLDVVVSGSAGGSDSSTMRQIDGLAFRTGLFTLD
jgi:hypothetical protein